MSVEVYFDPMCPWAHRTSIRVREVRRLVGIEVDWRFFSLEEVNREEGEKHPWERDWSYGWSQMRVGALLRHGGHGVPTLVLEGGVAVFGPVVLDPPTGSAAVRLWELVEGWKEIPTLYELRRPKTPADRSAIGEAFATYLDARAWRTVENPAP